MAILTEGKGELTADARHLRRDLRLIRKAARKGWIQADQTETVTPARMLEIVKTGKHREAIHAASVLVHMKRDNFAAMVESAKLQQASEIKQPPSVVVNINGPVLVQSPANAESGRSNPVRSVASTVSILGGDRKP